MAAISSQHGVVPLSATMKWTEALGATSVNHINQFPAATLSFNLAPGVPLETALTKLNQLTEELLSQVFQRNPSGQRKRLKNPLHLQAIC